MAAKLCTEAGSEAPAVEAKREEIGGKYAALQQDIQVGFDFTFRTFVKILCK